MARMIKCIKLGREAEGLDFPPYPGELGKRIYENVSKEAWQQWLRHQTMLINEYRLSPIEPNSKRRRTAACPLGTALRMIAYFMPLGRAP